MTDTEMTDRLAAFYNQDKSASETLTHFKFPNMSHWQHFTFGEWQPLTDRNAAAMVLEEMRRRELAIGWFAALERDCPYVSAQRLLELFLMPPRQQMEAVLKVLDAQDKGESQ